MPKSSAKRPSKRVPPPTPPSNRKRNRDTTSSKADPTLKWTPAKAQETDAPRVAELDFGAISSDGANVRSFTFNHSHGDSEAGVTYDHVLFVHCTKMVDVVSSVPVPVTAGGAATPAGKSGGGGGRDEDGETGAAGEGEDAEAAAASSPTAGGGSSAKKGKKGAKKEKPAAVPQTPQEEVEGYAQVVIPNDVDSDITATIDFENRCIKLAYKTLVTSEITMPGMPAPPPASDAEGEDDDLGGGAGGLGAGETETVTTEVTQEVIQKWSEGSVLAQVDPSSCTIGFEVFNRRAKVTNVKAAE